MGHFLQQHEFWSGIVGYWIFSAAVSSMPEPMPNGSQGYAWAYHFLHTIAGNLTTAFGSKIPGINNKIAPLLLVGILLLSSCHYQLHPGSVNRFDSESYDSLTVAQGVIQGGHDAYLQKKLSPMEINVLIKLEQSYNTARSTYVVWHSMAVSKNPSAKDLQPILEKDMKDLTSSITAFKGAK